MPTSSRGWHRLILRISLSGAHVFAWIFVFQYFFVHYRDIAHALASVALTYALSQVVVVLLTPWSALRLRHGFKRTLVYAVLALAAAFVALAASFAGYFSHVSLGISLFAILIGVYRALYWVPYEVSQPVSARGSTAREVVLAFIPALCGLMLTGSMAAPVILLSAAAVVALLSIIPLLNMRDTQEGYSWTYRGTFHELFSSQRRRYTLAALAGGIEAAALLLLWPLLIFMLLKWSYPMLGIVLTLTYLVTIGVHLFLHRPLSFATPGIHAISAISAWIMRLAVGGAVGVVLVDTFFYTGSRANSRGVDMVSFEQAADSSTFIDEHTALKEIAMGIGRILICLIVASVAGFASVSVIFIVAFVCAALAAVAAVFLGAARPQTL